MRTLFRIVFVIVILSVSGNGYSQGKQRIKPYFDELHRLVCPCGNRLVKNKLVKDQDRANMKEMVDIVAKYEYEKCSKCGTIWIWHCNPPKPDRFTVKPDFSKIENTTHEADSGSCYIVEYFPIPSRNICECTIKLKSCDRPLYCTVEGETGVRVVTKGHQESYLEKNGKRKKIFVTHENPGGFTPVRGESQ